MNRLVRHVKRAGQLLTGKGTQSKYVFTHFAQQRGLVYFGHIDTSEDDSQVVRGATLASAYRDAHYCVGTHDGYDIVCVQRLARIGLPNKTTEHAWIVMQIDLHTAVPLPHVLIGRRGRATDALTTELLGIKRDLQEHAFMSPTDHHAQFSRQFITLAPPSHAPLVEHIVTPDFTSAIVGHFKQLLIEVEDTSAYLFIDEAHPTGALLNKMLHYGIQFAKHIDERMGAE